MQHAVHLMGLLGWTLAGLARQQMVAKFGGTSMATAEAIRRVAWIVLLDPRIAWVVVSAPGRIGNGQKVTDLLLNCFRLGPDHESFDQCWQEVVDRFRGIVDELDLSINIEAELAQIHQQLKDGATEAFVASRGEYLSSMILARYLGWEFVDAAEVIRFTEDGVLDEQTTRQLLRARCLGHRIVIGGFYGAMEDGTIVTFARGGSDITGAYLAAFLDACLYRNYTDVSGVFRTDPRFDEHAEHLPEIDAGGFIALGAKVVHAQAVRVADRHGVVVQVRSTFAPRGRRTNIVPSSRATFVRVA